MQEQIGVDNQREQCIDLEKDRQQVVEISIGVTQNSQSVN